MTGSHLAQLRAPGPLRKHRPCPQSIHGSKTPATFATSTPPGTVGQGGRQPSHDHWRRDTVIGCSRVIATRRERFQRQWQEQGNIALRFGRPATGRMGRPAAVKIDVLSPILILENTHLISNLQRRASTPLSPGRIGLARARVQMTMPPKQRLGKQG
jgi:hypothetical protein